MYLCKKIFVAALCALFIVSFVGCSEKKEEPAPTENAVEKQEGKVYTETVVEFEEDRIYDPCVMQVNKEGTMEYVSLLEEQDTDKPKMQSFTYTYSEEQWNSAETDWGEQLKKELRKLVDLKNRIWDTYLSKGADGKFYVSHAFYHPNVVLEDKGPDYEYYVSNLLFRVDLDTNEVEHLEIPEASKRDEEKGVNALHCSAFSDGRLLIEDGNKAYIYDPVEKKKVCDIEAVTNAGNYVAGDGTLYSGSVNPEGGFEVCEYNIQDGTVSRKVALELYDPEKLSDATKYKLKVVDFDLYLLCKDGIYCLKDSAEEFEKVVDGRWNGLSKMTDDENSVFDFVVLENDSFAVNYRRLTNDNGDFEEYDKEYLAFYQPEG